MFGTIKSLRPQNIENWENTIFLTLDMDWCSDEVLSCTLDILEEFNIKATFFVTHDTKLLERMRENKNIELGIHPNFNPLLNGDFRYGRNIDDVICFYKKIVPEAISVRSHSMVQSSLILDAFEKHELIYDCNTFIPFSSHISLAPYRHWTKNLIKVPYFWEDDIHCTYGWKWDIAQYLTYNGLKVFDFHPIHIFLNTENLERYDQARPYLQNFQKLKKFKNTQTYGTNNFLTDLIQNAKINYKGI